MGGDCGYIRFFRILCSVCVFCGFHFDVFRFFLLHNNVPGGNGTGVAFWDCFEGSQALNVGFCGSWELLSFQKGDCGAHF